MNFVHLNTHSKASLLFGSADIQDLVNKAKELKQSAIALTDYNNLYNAILFYKQAKSAGIKPILGATLNFCEDVKEAKIQKSRDISHIVLLAENDIGWHNLTRLISLSNDEDHYYYCPRIDFAALEKHKEGIICLTGNSFDSIIAKHLYDKYSADNDLIESAAVFKAEGLTRRLLKIFDTSHLFFEVQDTKIKEQIQINERLRKIASKYNIKTVATGNVHYVNQHDAEAHNTLLQMNELQYNRSTFTDFSKDEYYLKSRDDFASLDIRSEELDLTVAIADRCTVNIDINKRRLPQYQFIPDGKTSIDYLIELANDGLTRIPKSYNYAEYQSRLDRELLDIKEMGLSDYFLIVHDVISWIRNQGILMGRGRGSAGGSLVSYCLGITDIDPLQYGLIWERFLNKGRGGLPDIDSDVPRTQRQKVLEYIKTRFGDKNVAQLVTFSGLQARAILKEVFRVYDMPFEKANHITSLIPAKNDEHVAISLDEAIETVPELKKYAEEYKPWFTIARSLEGCYKATGIHAAAVVISDVPFDESAYPLSRSKDGDLIFGWDMNTVDNLNLLKLDILGLNTLDDIQTTMDLIKTRRGISISRSMIPLDDPVTYAMLGQGFTVGVFQLEKQLGKTWSKNLKPETIEQLSDLISIIRPGPMESQMHTQYQDVKINNAEPSYIHSTLGPILKDTYSSLLYQEQVIEICKQLANMTLIDADHVRKAMGKKKPEEMKKWKTIFIDGCLKNNIEPNIAEDIWDYIDKFAGYGFNRSHGVGYALLAYETAYLKANYPIEFICAKLRNAEGDLEKLNAMIYDAKLFNVDILPPRLTSPVNKDFAIINDTQVIFGMSAIKGLGAGAINDIGKIFQNKDTFDNIIFKWASTKTKLTSAMMIALIKCGAFDNIVEHRIRALAKFKLFEALTDKEREMLIKLETLSQDWLATLRLIADDKTSADIKVKYQITIPNTRRRETIRDLLKEYDSNELFDTRTQRIGWEQFYLGISLSGSEADIYKSRHKCVDLIRQGSADMKFEISVCIDKIKEHTTKKGDAMAFLTVRDNTYQMDNVVVFPKVFQKHQRLLEAGNVIKINGNIDDRGSLIANFIERLK
jgi:DNA polymerase III subunit alpha